MANPQTKNQRTKKLEKATKNNPYFELTELREIAEDADKFHSLKVVFEQEGGQLIVGALTKDIMGNIDRLSQYQSMSRDDLVSVAASITTQLGILRALTGAEENLRLADEALEEELHTPR